MSQFCGCLGSTKPEPRTQIPSYPDAGFMHRPETQMQMHMHMQHQLPRYDSVDHGYAPVVPLPRYTPRPMSIHEKTLENNHIHHTQHRPDEKNRHDFESAEDEDVSALNSQSTGGSSTTVTGIISTITTAPTTIMDDASSAYSFPSSFGHTSTETRDTPPPPYSSCGSSFYARSRASSVRSHGRSESLFNYSLNNTGNASEVVPTITPPPMAHMHISHNHDQYQHHPSPSIHAPRQSISRSNTPSQRRFSWESR
ncbi:hypothetical protein TMatcc_008541 [Talaromyces marneffei ATCC 18224]|uniref:uncharacterized protein n=1 Tax=Talaromyces marneffei TaxID=37727 RepID=UPI0012A9C6DB|nr:uncharacterized protein EYB26_007874 [Talaromyces marneffei]KAE8550505.1 hypothetical protein EYB25_006732 [Talaromyces marneffei]QGA20173.1 hypothetical protein EYB26_007874 [Talaromyces marneffei]